MYIQLYLRSKDIDWFTFFCFCHFFSIHSGSGVQNWLTEKTRKMQLTWENDVMPMANR